MIIKVNNKEIDIPSKSNLSSLIETMQLPSAGVAAAVNNKLITKAEWDSFTLSENDNVVIIKAACGV